ncbi:MAG: GntR family transcriptional regulator [bacterium]|jgi:DNA-binding LacI/PurR family transcriptional regulator
MDKRLCKSYIKSIKNCGEYRVDKNNALPLYLQLEALIRNEIEFGAWKAGEILPTEEEFCRKYNVGQITVKRALRDLAKEGLLSRIKGKGTFVKPSIPVAGRRNKIALIVPDIDDIFISEIYHGIEEVAVAKGYRVATYSSGRQIENENQNIGALIESDENGAIIFPYWGRFNASGILALKRKGFPFVLIDRYFPEIQADTVTVDNIGGAITAVAHLIELGHKRIGHIGGVNCTANEDRLEGYRRALGEAGIPYDADIVKRITATDMDESIRFEPDDVGGYKQMKELLCVSERPTAFFAGNDYIAFGAIRAVKEVGLKIPDDVAIAGFDDLKFSASLEIPLTTVYQPKYEIGKTAASILMEKIEDKDTEIRRIVLPTSLVVRESSGAKPIEYKDLAMPMV